MKSNKFLKGTLILIIFNLIGKVVGAVYRIPLASIVGGEGMGQYQLTFPLYCLILTIATSGIPVAISKLVSEFNSKENYQSSKKLLKISILILTIISVVSAVIVALSARLISSWQGNPEIYICYYAIAPAILFVGILSAFRGYFQGNLIMYPTAISSLIEQVIKLFAGLFFAKKLLVYGIEYAVFGAILGVSLSELFACVFLVICYIFHSKTIKKNKAEIKVLPAKALSKQLMTVSLPITFGGLIAPLTSMFDSLLVVNLLMVVGFSSATSTMMLGLQSGVVEPLVNIPVIIAVSIATALLPSISELATKNKKEEINSLIKKSFEISLSIATTCFVCFIIFGRQILGFLYGQSFGGYELSIAVKLLFLGSINIIFLSLVQVSSGILQGLSHQKYPVKSLLIGCIVKIALDIALILIPSINIFGAVLSAGACYIVVFMLNFRKIVKLTNVNFSRVYGNVAIQQAFVCLFAYFLNKLFLPLFGRVISLFVSGAITGIIFLLTFYLMFLRKNNLNFEQKLS